MVSIQVQVCMYGRCSRWNKTYTVQKWVFCQTKETKYMGRPLHDHWDVRILQPVLSPIQAGYQAMEVNLVKTASTRDTISKGGNVNNAEPMEYREPKVTGKVKERNLSGPYLARPDPCRRLYIKTEWSNYGMWAVLFQEDVSEEARKSEAQEKDGGKCEFDKSLEGISLRKIYFISISTVSPLDKSRHSFVGGAASVRWAIRKSRKYLWGS